MFILTVQIKCDKCGEYLQNESGLTYFNNKDDAMTMRIMSGWVVDEDYHICRKCVEKVCKS
jgi:hypothetical protein